MEVFNSDLYHIIIDKKWRNSTFFFREEGNSEPFITPAGFQFLLMDTASQVWYFMREYLNTSEVMSISAQITTFSWPQLSKR